MRVLNRVVCAVLALSLLVGGLLVASEVVLAGIGREQWLVPYGSWQRTAETTPWSDSGLRLALAGLVLAGLVLLALQLSRRRSDEMVMARSAGADAHLDRRSAERWLAERVQRVEGVVDATARLGRRAAVVRVAPVGRRAEGLEERVRQAATDHLRELGLAEPLRVTVEVHSGGGR